MTSPEPAAAMDRTQGPVPWPSAQPPSETPSRPALWQSVVPWGVMAVLLLSLFNAPLPFDRSETVAVCVLLLPIGWLQTVLHEGGHALTGLMSGMRPLAFGIGPFRVERTLSGWRWRHGGAISGVGGFALLVPSVERGHQRRDAAWYMLGGPLANLLVAGVALLLLRQMHEPSMTRAVLATLVLSGVLCGVLNLLPFTIQGWRSDGRNLLDLLMGHSDAILMRQLQMSGALSRSGVRPRDWPPGLAPAQIPEQGWLRPSALMVRMAWAEDTGDVPLQDDTAQALAECFWSSHPAMRPMVALALSGHAIRSGDGAVARAWRPLCDGSVIHLGGALRWLDASLALDAGDTGEALAHLTFARMEVARMHDIATAQRLVEHLDELQQRIDQTPATAEA